jgi:hypothetical protein
LTLGGTVVARRLPVSDQSHGYQDRFVEEYERDFESFEVVDLGQVAFDVTPEGLPVVADTE